MNPIRTVVCSAALVALAAWSVPLAAEPQGRDVVVCLNKNNRHNVERQLEACTAAIDAGQASRFQLAEAYVKRALIFLNKYDTAHAIADLTIALQHLPGNHTIILYRAVAYSADGQFERAIFELDDALVEADVYALNARCHAKAMLGRADAVADCDRALQKKPREASFLNARALAKFRTNQLEAARADAQAVADAEPDDATSRFLLGLILNEMGDHRGADAAFAEARKVASDDDWTTTERELSRFRKARKP